MNLQDRLDAFRADYEAGKPPYNAPPEASAVMHRATDELIAGGQAERALKAGDVAPQFILDDVVSIPVSLHREMAKGPMVLSFFHGVWSPYCKMELQALQAILPEIEARGAYLIAISPQTPSNNRKSQRDNMLAFPILSDAKSEVAYAFGIRFALPDYLVDLYKGLGNNLPLVNDDPSWVLPMPARYIVGTDGVIAYAEVNPDCTQRPDPLELLPVLDALAKSRAA